VSPFVAPGLDSAQARDTSPTPHEHRACQRWRWVTNPAEQFNEADYLDIRGASRAINGGRTGGMSPSSLTSRGADFRWAKTRRVDSLAQPRRWGPRSGAQPDVAWLWTKHRRQDRPGL